MTRPEEPTAVFRGEPEYEDHRRASVWQSIVPDRYPAAIVRVRDARMAQAALADAQRAGRSVSVISSGHSYIGSSLRDDAVLLDVSAIAHIEVDRVRGLARAGPGATNGALNAALEPLGLAFPVGHSPSVALGGYLLGGGLGWNPTGWGIACSRVAGASVLLADGRLVEVDASHYPDLFFALRGGGPHFPGIVLEYRLDLVTRPARITELSYRLPVIDLAMLTRWAEAVSLFSHDVECAVTVTVIDGAPAAFISAVAFADDTARAAEALAPAISALPPAARADATIRHSTLAELLAANDDQRARYAVEGFWADRAADVLPLAVHAVTSAPAGIPLLHVSIGRDGVVPPGMAFSVAAPVFAFASSAWTDPDLDEEHLQWQDELLHSAAPVSIGAYVNECDHLRRPERLRACFTDAALDRLHRVIRQYDPNGVLSLPISRHAVASDPR